MGELAKCWRLVTALLALRRERRRKRERREGEEVREGGGEGCVLWDKKKKQVMHEVDGWRNHDG